MINHHSLLRIICVLALILFGFGCSSVDTSVTRYLDRGEFEKARLALDKAGVGETVAEDAAPEAMLAREQFQKAIEAEYTSRSAKALDKGLARHAQSVIREASQLCPWSELLNRALEDRSELVSALDAFAVRASQFRGESIPRQMKVEVLASSDPIFQFINDSPAVQISLNALQQDIIHAIAKEVVVVNDLGDEWSRVAVHDLQVAGLPADRAREFRSRLVSLSQLITGAPEEISQAALILILQDPPTVASAAERDLYRALIARTRAWLEDPSSTTMLQKIASFSVVDRLEWLFADSAPNNAAKTAIEAVAKSRIDALSRDGNTAALAWLYLSWASQYTTSMAHGEYQQQIDAALSSRVSRPLSVTMIPSPGIDPILQRLLQMEFYDLIENDFSSAVEWSWLPREDANDADLKIAVDNARMLVPDISTLPSVQSKFLSHYEDVPNPTKQFLQSQLSSQKFALEMSELRYEQAVSSHNLYPTQYSLSNANMARSSYSIALASYNSLVNRYNLTPSTIRSPVYLPYVFYAGTIEVGFSASGIVSYASRSVPSSSSEVDRDIVRKGTKVDDTVAENRFDDRLDLDTSVSAQMDRLSRVVHEWSDEVALALSDINSISSVPVKSDEKTVLAWLDHPGCPRRTVALQRDVPDWAQQLSRDFSLPKLTVEPPRTILASRKRPASAEPIESKILHATCKIESRDPNGNVVSHGSGALISSDGLILTCAHVLMSSNLEVTILEGPSAGRYPATVLFKNASTDVALLQTVGLKSESWLGVDLQPVNRGTKVLVSGYPSAGRGSIAQAALTEGVIITPIGDQFGQPRLVADVTIASGSSGGPMIDIESGLIIGVVTAVASNDFGPDRAASGAFCLAAPASKLSEWLGLQIEMAQPIESIPENLNEKP